MIVRVQLNGHPVDVRTTSATARIGDLVATGGRLYKVDEVGHRGSPYVGVVDVETGRYPNSFSPREVHTVSRRDWRLIAAALGTRQEVTT